MYDGVVRLLPYPGLKTFPKGSFPAMFPGCGPALRRRRAPPRWPAKANIPKERVTSIPPGQFISQPTAQGCIAG